MYVDLDDLIKHSSKPLEIIRGLVIKKDLEGKSRKEIESFMSKGPSFISKWRSIYDEFGVMGLLSTYKGGSPRSFLSVEEREQVISHIKKHEVFGPTDLRKYLKATFAISFKSMQSYYELLHDAKMSWHKSQKTNPRRDEQKIKERRKELKKNSKSGTNQSKIVKQ